MKKSIVWLVLFVIISTMAYGLESLKLTSNGRDCDRAQLRARNQNNFDLTYQWQVAGTGVWSDSRIAPANGEDIFIVDAPSSSTTVITRYWDDSDGTWKNGQTKAVGTSTPWNPEVSIEKESYGKNEDIGNIAFKLVLPFPSTCDLWVNYETSAITATPGSDYEDKSGKVKIPAGSTEKWLTLQIVNPDVIFEPDDSLKFDLLPSDGVVFGARTSAIGIIKNDDPEPDWRKVNVVVWHDVNEDGEIGRDEKGLPGVEILADKYEDAEAKHLTDENGKCFFTFMQDLEKTFTLVEGTLPAGAYCTTGAFVRTFVLGPDNPQPIVLYGIAGGNSAQAEGGLVIPAIEPLSLPGNFLVYVPETGSPVYSVKEDHRGWEKAVDKELEGWQGTTWAKPAEGEESPSAIFKFFDDGTYKFNYVNFMTDNGTDDNGEKKAWQATELEVLVSTTGMEDDDFTSIGLFQRTYGVNKLQWNRLPAYVEAKYIKVKLTQPDGAPWVQLVEFDVNTENKAGAVPASDAADFVQLPQETELMVNYPNPFNPTTSIQYRLKSEAQVSLAIFDITGRQVAELVNAKQAPGSYTVQWDASKMASGIYFYTIHAGSFNATRRMMLIK